MSSVHFASNVLNNSLLKDYTLHDSKWTWIQSIDKLNRFLKPYLMVSYMAMVPIFLYQYVKSCDSKAKKDLKEKKALQDKRIEDRKLNARQRRLTEVERVPDRLARKFLMLYPNSDFTGYQGWLASSYRPDSTASEYVLERLLACRLPMTEIKEVCNQKMQGQNTITFKLEELVEIIRARPDDQATRQTLIETAVDTALKEYTVRKEKCELSTKECSFFKCVSHPYSPEQAHVGNLLHDIKIKIFQMAAERETPKATIYFYGDEKEAFSDNFCFGVLAKGVRVHIGAPLTTSGISNFNMFFNKFFPEATEGYRNRLQGNKDDPSSYEYRQLPITMISDPQLEKTRLGMIRTQIESLLPNTESMESFTRSVVKLTDTDFLSLQSKMRDSAIKIGAHAKGSLLRKKQKEQKRNHINQIINGVFAAYVASLACSFATKAG